MIVNATGSWNGMALMASANPQASLMDSLPDPMKLQLPAVAFIIVILTLLFFFLKSVLFKPLSKLMDDREEAIRAGSAAKSDAATQVEARQADYTARLKELRGKAFEHRKVLANAVAVEKQKILETARQTASTQRAQALLDLGTEQKAAEAELKVQVEALSDSMVQHLLKQA